MNFLSDPIDNPKGAITRRRAEPAQVPAEIQDSQRTASVHWLRRLWSAVRGYTASDAARLKEAALKGVEGESAKRVNEAKKLEAEARLLHVDADAKEQEQAIDKLKAAKEEGIPLWAVDDQVADRFERVADATERLANAISRIRQQGGDVGFDAQQIESVLEQLELEAVLSEPDRIKTVQDKTKQETHNKRLNSDGLPPAD